jgi:Fe-S-cluster-containing dehydrogenase component
MHCDSPTCAEVCPADAIKKTPDGIVQSAKKERCVGCNNCGLACPFGVPKVEVTGIELMMKCDMCYDRTSAGLKPMCASVCPSQALFFGTRQQLQWLRPMSAPLNQFQFGQQTIRTKVNMLIPATDTENSLDVTAHLTPPSIDDMMMAGLYEVDPVCP